MFDVQSWLASDGLILLAAIVFGRRLRRAALGDQVGYMFGRRRPRSQPFTNR